MNLKKKRSKSFTLIEILVVIVVIGILSAFILVGINSITENANITKSKAFSNSIRNSLLTSLVSEWKLDSNTNDSWNLNNGTWTGPTGANTTANYRPSSECVSGQCLNFDGTDDRVGVTNNPTLNMTSRITIEAWIKPSRLDIDYQGIVVKGLGSYGYHFMIYFAVLRPYARFGGVWSTVANGLEISLNKWNYVAWTYDGSLSRVYVDSRKTSSSRSGDISYESDDNLYIGHGKYSPYFFNGLIDEVKIYNEAFSSSKINNNYYSGLNKLLAKEMIDNEEFRQKLGELKNNLLVDKK